MLAPISYMLAKENKNKYPTVSNGSAAEWQLSMLTSRSLETSDWLFLAVSCPS